MTPLALRLQKTAAHLRPHRDTLVGAWATALRADADDQAKDVHDRCAEEADALLARMADGEAERFLADEEARIGADRSVGLAPMAELRAMQAFQRSCLDLLLSTCEDRAALSEAVTSLHELTSRRLDLLVRAEEHEAARRLHEAQEQAQRQAEKARELLRLNEALRRSQEESRHRAEQIGLLGAVVHKVAGVLEPERLMREAAEVIQVHMDYMYAAVVVLDDEGVLVGRWAGRPGVGRRSAGRAQGPARGVIGRALRKRAPQVVPDVTRDPDYVADVDGVRSEMVVPLLENGEAVGALDVQGAETDAFGLDDVAVGETIAEFLVVALRNARLVADLRRGPSPRA